MHHETRPEEVSMDSSKTALAALQEKMNALKAIKRLFTHRHTITALDGTLSAWMDNRTTVNADYDEEQHKVLEAAITAEKALDDLRIAMATYEVFHYQEVQS
jgi:hypothetical protein